MPSVSEQLQAILGRLTANVSGVQKAIVGSSDGLILASTSMSESDERMSAMCASLLSIGRRTSQTMEKPDLNDITIRTDEGYITLFAVGSEAVLVVSTSAEQKNLGMLYLEGKQATAAMYKVLVM
ncbi:MAG TPA: roadblock/LC7 domain-containing protein [Caldisericia bacterium]|nr:roadblock/LC7 domain-containing protein [Caldisericia bacterium]HPF48396.1 roadblock/LC7 domain-containing protein [Caldisericia bacterium]HPI83424.1 roadblock/LC7 domain-containing protein [Caldisericia bacterium]HPQ92850.1 roadblock/LC7 domain-containing protein [Caldisericia bacterium]HRV74052.1 roadblock/LC7 domain-containing protein [Caldisericia bacterium]